MSMYENVRDFNKQFGVEQSSKSLLNDEQFINTRMELIREEMRELEEAVKNKDMTETIDALTDILYVTLGMGFSLDIDLDKSFTIVHESNMSKMCDTEEQAIKTVEWYKTNDNRYDSPAYRKNKSGKYIVYNASTRKILKSIDYKPAVFNIQEL